MSDVSLINLALSRLRVKQRLVTLGDTETGRLAASVYAETRDRLLSAYNWGFARRTAGLTASTGTAPIGWAYHYALPTDCLIVRRVVDEGGARYVGRFSYGEDWHSEPVNYPWQIANTDQGRVVVCDLSPAYAVMTWRVTDSSEYPPMFRDALAWWLAAEMGPALNVDDGAQERADRWAPQAAALAFAQDGNQMTADPAPESLTVRVRG